MAQKNITRMVLRSDLDFRSKLFAIAIAAHQTEATPAQLSWAQLTQMTGLCSGAMRRVMRDGGKAGWLEAYCSLGYAHGFRVNASKLPVRP